MRDVAERAGVTRACVSYALRNHPKISAATRARIWAIAEELGYRPDPAFEILGAHRWRQGRKPTVMTMAYLAPAHAEWTGFQEACFQGARTHALALGYNLTHFCLQEYPSPERASRVLYHRGVRGLIVRRLNQPGEVEGLDWRHFSAVACGLGYYRPPLHMVMTNHLQNLNLVWRKIAEAGYRKIGLVAEERSPLAEIPELYLGGFYFHQSRLPKSHRIPVLVCEAGSNDSFAAWIRRHQPEVVIGCTDEVHGRAVQSGFRIPGNFAFVSLERVRQHAPTGVGEIAGLDLQPDRLGQIAVDLLDLQIKRNYTGLPEVQQTLLVDAAWQDGRSLPSR